jgi:hypothetical protein
MVLFRQQEEVGLLPSKSFGGQVKMRDMRCFDVAGDGADEVFVLSADEEFIAHSSYGDKRLSFPKALPTTGKPYALDVGRLSEKSPAMIAYVSRDENSDYQLIVQPASEDSTVETRAFAIKELNDPPTAVRLADVNRDGLNDVLIFASYSPLVTFLQTADGNFEPLGEGGKAQKGLVKQAAIEGFAFVDANGDGRSEVLLAQKAFVRALCVNEDGTWEILDQYNAPGADTDITGVITFPMDGGKRPHLAMFDQRGREVHVFKPADGGTFELDRSVQVGAFDLKFITAAPLAGDGRMSIVLADKRRVAVIRPETPAARARELGAYESSIKDARLTRLVSGDLNNDGRPDLAVIDIKDHFVEILTFGPQEALVRGNKFRVFAKKQYSGFSGAGGAPEPRWIEARDVTDDGIDDLILIAHDRILLYPGR